MTSKKPERLSSGRVHVGVRVEPHDAEPSRADPRQPVPSALMHWPASTSGTAPAAVAAWTGGREAAAFEAR
jgi:hypothetical protein